MSDKPILFSGPMVRALLARRKTQTRRVHAISITEGERFWVREAWRVSKNHDDVKPRDLPARLCTVFYESGGSSANTDDGWKIDSEWPRGGLPDWAGRIRPGMFMPRWASRLTLLVTGVRHERLQDISEPDAQAEGMVRCDVVGDEAYGAWSGGTDFIHGDSARGAYRRTWELINGPGSWEANPFVAAYSFRVIKENIDCIKSEERSRD